MKERRDVVIETLCQYENSIWKCLSCGYTTRSKSYIKEHVEQKHIDDGESYICKFCAKPIRSINSLRLHISYNHKIKATTENLY